MKSFAQIKAEMEAELKERNEKLRASQRQATQARVAKPYVSGVCPKCHTYCDGDCSGY